MNEAEYQELQEAGWRRRLTPAEEARIQAWLAAQPERRAEWEAEAGLNQWLGQLPDVPVASNFTARVMQKLDRERLTAPRRAGLAEWFSRAFRRPAVGLG